MKALIVMAFVFSQVTHASDYLKCTREANGYKFDVVGTVETEWSKVAADDLRADGKLAAVRTGGKKSVRNYDAEYHLHKKAGTMWISLSKRNTGYGDLNLTLKGKTITSAVLKLANDQELELDCKFVK